jgi:hypothetical protein
MCTVTAAHARHATSAQASSYTWGTVAAQLHVVLLLLLPPLLLVMHS